MYEVQKYQQNYIVTADRHFNRKYQLVARMHAHVPRLGKGNFVTTGSSNKAKTFKDKMHSLVANAIGKMSAFHMVDSKEVTVDPLSQKDIKYKTVVPADEYENFKAVNRAWLSQAMIVARVRYRRREVILIKYVINNKDIVRAKHNKTGKFVKTPSKKWLKQKKVKVF